MHAFAFKMAYHPGKDDHCADSLFQLPVSAVVWEGPMSKQQLLDVQEQVHILSAVKAQLLYRIPIEHPQKHHPKTSLIFTL